MKNSCLIAFATFLSTSSLAQPIITAANFNPLLGDAFTYHTWTPTSLAPGASGANATWNQASNPNQSTVSFTFVTPASTPYAATFPGSSLASQQSGSYEYVITSSSALERKGAWSGGVAVPYANPQTLMTYPFTFNSTYNDTWTASYTSNGYTFNRTGTVNGTADGYGTLMLPGITLTNVLRVHYEETYEDVSIIGTFNYTSDNYGWMIPGTHYVVASMSQLNTPQGIFYFANYMDPLSIGIDVNESESSFHVFPNPTTDVLNINIDLRGGENIGINILNATGQTVFTLNDVVSGSSFQKAINVNQFPEGLYIINLKSGNTAFTTKFVVQR